MAAWDLTDALTPDEVAQLHGLLVRIVAHQEQEDMAGRPRCGR